MELERKIEFGESGEFVELGENEQSAKSGGHDAERDGLDSGFRRNSPSAALRASDGGSGADLPPEFCQYQDEGCELAESCLKCPFARCIYEEPGGKQRWLRRRRAKEIAHLHIIEGKKIKEISDMFGISQRTVQRDLKRASNSS